MQNSSVSAQHASVAAIKTLLQRNVSMRYRMMLLAISGLCYYTSAYTTAHINAYKAACDVNYLAVLLLNK
jgi:hypothetical protein